MPERRDSRTARLVVALVFGFVVVAAAGAQATASDGAKPPTVDFLGQAILPTGTTFAGTTIGGLSSISYDEDRGAFYVLSDDPSQFQPARFYTLHLDIGDGALATGDVHFDASHDPRRPGRPAVPAVQSRPRGPDAHERPRARRYVGGDCDAAGRAVGAAPTISTER